MLIPFDNSKCESEPRGFGICLNLGSSRGRGGGGGDGHERREVGRLLGAGSHLLFSAKTLSQPEGLKPQVLGLVGRNDV